MSRALDLLARAEAARVRQRREEGAALTAAHEEARELRALLRASEARLDGLVRGLRELAQGAGLRGEAAQDAALRAYRLAVEVQGTPPKPCACHAQKKRKP